MKDQAITAFRGWVAAKNRSYQGKKTAFTLAEVLITLGIIGIVAAMTLPTLIGNYKKKVWETSFKKSVNFILNSHKKLFADEGIDSLCDLPYFECGASAGLDGIKVKDTMIADYTKNLGLEKASIDEAIFGLYDKDSFYVAKDGSCYAFDLSLFTSTVDFPDGTYEIFVDTNCAQKPNKGGRDRFFIVLDRHLTLVLDVDNGGETRKKQCESLIKYVNTPGASNVEGVEGYAAIYCGAYMIESSYNMDY